PDRGVPEDVVRARRFLDPQRLELGQRLDPFDRLRYVPDLVRVDHQVPVGPEYLARDAATPDVVVEVRADIELHVFVARGNGILGTPAQLGTRAPEPTRRGRVAGIPGGDQLVDPLFAATFPLGQERDRLVRREHIGQVAQIRGRHEFLR